MLQSSSIHCHTKKVTYSTYVKDHNTVQAWRHTHTHTQKKKGNHFPVWVSYEHSWPNLGLMGLHTLSNLEDLKAMTPHHHPPKSKVLGIGSLAGHSLAHARSTSIAVRWRFSPGPDGARQNRRLNPWVTRHDWLGNPFPFWGCIDQAMYPNDE